MQDGKGHSTTTCKVIAWDWKFTRSRCILLLYLQITRCKDSQAIHFSWMNLHSVNLMGAMQHSWTSAKRTLSPGCTSFTRRWVSWEASIIVPLGSKYNLAGFCKLFFMLNNCNIYKQQSSNHIGKLRRTWNVYNVIHLHCCQHFLTWDYAGLFTKIGMKSWMLQNSRGSRDHWRRFCLVHVDDCMEC